jgi:hypothetical protein
MKVGAIERQAEHDCFDTALLTDGILENRHLLGRGEAERIRVAMPQMLARHSCGGLHCSLVDVRLWSGGFSTCGSLDHAGPPLRPSVEAAPEVVVNRLKCRVGAADSCFAVVEARLPSE